MRVHHLNCADMRPRGARLIHGEGGWLDEARIVGHVLVVESRDGLVLVDTGFGLHDVAQPQRRLGRGFLLLNRPRLRAEDTAARQLHRLGLRPGDVRHIVATHLDVDHAGGIADFPLARVHVHDDELEAALHPQKLIERLRYNPAQFDHRPRWAPHKTDGERWFGFQSVRAVLDDILLIPLPGHSRGHSAVAVRLENSWLLHAGDAYFCKDELHPERPSCPPGLDLIQRMDEVDRRARLANQARLRALVLDYGGEVEVFCAHDRRELDGLAPRPLGP
jgi:glyoxylase-like metal-dependent hydrolase (beta-lactamase superfamily II)